MTDPETILEKVASLFGVTCDDLTSRSRRARLMPARHAAAYALRQAGYSLLEIGDVLRRDHTTIISSLKATQRRADVDLAYAAKLRMLTAACDGAPAPPAPPAAASKRRDAWVVSESVHIALFFWGIVEPATA